MNKLQETPQDAQRPVERLVIWLMIGFPSPWRWLRRVYWTYRWDSMPTEMKWLAIMQGIDIDRLIQDGKL